jgi:sodium-dependent dicarboxylate transporter 2/3/5
MLATATLSAFVSNTATAAMMLPIGIGVINLVNESVRSQPTPQCARAQRSFAVCLMLGIAYGASIGGLATIVGSPPNVFLVGFVEENLGTQISFRDWMLVGVPLAAVFLPLAWFLLTRILHPVQRSEVPGGREFLQATQAALGPVNRGQVATFTVFMAAAALWILRPTLAGVSFGTVAPFKLLGDAGIAIGAGLALFVIPSGVRGGFVMDWNTARNLPWGILILFGGGLSLANAIQTNGVAEFIASHVRHVGADPILLVLVVTAAVILLSELASNTATVATIVPILAAMAAGLEVSPFLLIVPATLAASCAFMLPAGTPPNALVFGSGYVSMRDMISAGLWLNLTGVILITGLSLLLPKVWSGIMGP